MAETNADQPAARASARESGWYWVRLPHGRWSVAECKRGEISRKTWFFRLIDSDHTFIESDLREIGPRIPSPDEARPAPAEPPAGVVERLTALVALARDVAVYEDAPKTHEMDNGEAGIVIEWDPVWQLAEWLRENAATLAALEAPDGAGFVAGARGDAEGGGDRLPTRGRLLAGIRYPVRRGLDGSQTREHYRGPAATRAVAHYIRGRAMTTPVPSAERLAELAEIASKLSDFCQSIHGWADEAQAKNHADIAAALRALGRVRELVDEWRARVSGDYEAGWAFGVCADELAAILDGDKRETTND